MSWLTELITPVTGSFIKDIGDTVKQFVTTDKDTMELKNKLAEIETAFKAKIMDIGVQYEQLAAKNAEDINKTMQSEAGAEHWPTYSWRPFIGFVFGIQAGIMALTVAFAYIAVMLGYAKPEILSYIPQMLAAMAALMAVEAPILGVASWFRGKMQADPTIPTVNRG